MTNGVEVPLNEDEISDLRMMLMSPGFNVLLRFMDGKIAAMRRAAEFLGETDPMSQDLGVAFLKANAAQEFREAVNREVLRVVNETREQNDSILPDSNERIRQFMGAADSVSRVLAASLEIPVTGSKYRR